MAFKFVFHAIGMIFGNLGQALRVSVGPTLLIWLIYIGILSPLREIAMGNGWASLIFGLGTLALSMVVTSWIAVSWHRFVLLEEHSNLLPPFRGQIIAAYVKKLILLTLILLLIGSFFFGAYYLLLMIPLAAAGTGMQPWLQIITLLLTLIGTITLYVAGLRMGVALVAAALGRNMTFRDAFEASREKSGMIWGIVIIYLILSGSAVWLLERLALSNPVSAMVSDVLINWLVTLSSASLLTTLYGYVVEGRSLGRKPKV